MAKGAYIGVSGAARKVKKGYVGVDGAARKIKKAYLGVGGVARPCWSGGEVTYYGIITPLSAARRVDGAVTVGDYALFAGGATMVAIGAATWATVDTYDKNLTKSFAPDLSQARIGNTGASVGEYALIVGGYCRGSTFRIVDIYDEDLTHTTTELSSAVNGGRGCGSTPDYAIFLYGPSYPNQAFAYNANLTRTTVTPHGCNGDGGTTMVGDYVIYAEGGAAYSYSNSLVRNAMTALSKARVFSSVHAATKNHALITGGASEWGGPDYAAVDAYDDETLTRSTISDLSAARSWHHGVDLSGNAVLFGGWNSDTTEACGAVDVYDEDLVHKTFAGLTPTGSQGATVVGNYAIFAGGSTGNLISDVTDVAHVFTVV